MDIRIERYTDDKDGIWDNFIEDSSYNGTFLQTRNFLSYHPKGKFEDFSLLFYKGESTLIAVLPAVVEWEDGRKILNSHPGSTWGGICVAQEFYDIAHVSTVLESLEDYLAANEFSRVILKQTSQIFSKKPNDLLDYFFYHNGYQRYSELSLVCELEKYPTDVISAFDTHKRRDYRNSVRNGLEFKELNSLDEIKSFYCVLQDNLKKFDRVPVHTYEELVDFKQLRLTDIVDFYGVYYGDRMVAGSMVFRFNQEIFHTQYLAASQGDLNLYPNNFLYTNLLMIAKEEGYRYLSFGISTEQHGKVLNRSLAEFKESHGATYSNNHTYWKNIGGIR